MSSEFVVHGSEFKNKEQLTHIGETEIDYAGT